MYGLFLTNRIMIFYVNVELILNQFRITARKSLELRKNQFMDDHKIVAKVVS